MGVIDRDGGKTVWVVLDGSSFATVTDDAEDAEDAEDADVDALLSTYGDHSAPSGSATARAIALQVAA